MYVVWIYDFGPHAVDEIQDEGEDSGYTLGVLCEIETEVKSVQLDNVFFYEFIFKDFTDLIVHTR